MSSKKMIVNAITTVLALGISGMSSASQDKTTNAATHTVASPDGMEKCYGVTKAGMNDCGTATHSCAGEAKVDNDKSAWVFVPTGLCNKIVGGSTKSG